MIIWALIEGAMKMAKAEAANNANMAMSCGEELYLDEMVVVYKE